MNGTKGWMEQIEDRGRPYEHEALDLDEWEEILWYIEPYFDKDEIIEI